MIENNQAIFERKIPENQMNQSIPKWHQVNIIQHKILDFGENDIQHNLVATSEVHLFFNQLSLGFGTKFHKLLPQFHG